MLLWIIIGVAVLAIGGWTFWPRERGVADREFRRRMESAQSDGAMKAGRPYSGDGPVGPGGRVF